MKMTRSQQMISLKEDKHFTAICPSTDGFVCPLCAVLIL